MDNRVGPWCRTFYSKRKFFFHNVHQNEYLIHDIALGLAQTNRYGGQALFPYSVAQHSILMARKIYEDHNSAVLAMDCLFHDAAEAYLGDIRGPLKRLIPGFADIEDNVDEAIRKTFAFMGVPARQMPITKEYDGRIVIDEMCRLLPRDGPDFIDPRYKEPLGVKIDSMSWGDAESEWLRAVYFYAERATAESGKVKKDA